MTLRIQRSFIATVAAVAIAITGISAVPARADDRDVAKALAIVLGLAVVGTAISKRNDDKKAHKKVYTQKAQPRVHKRHAKPTHRRVNRKLLPQQCLHNLRTDRGKSIQAFGQRCLSRNYAFTDSLPRQCERRVRTRNGAGYAYGARCLDRQGYQLARR